MGLIAPQPAVSASYKSTQTVAYGAFVLLGLIWGSNFIFMKWAAASITPEQIVLLRIVFGFMPLFGFALVTRSLHWRHLRHVHHFMVMALLATTDQHGIMQVFADRRATLGLVLGLGLCGTGLADILYYIIVDRLGATAASGVTYVPPVVALMIGVLSVGELVNLLDVAAMLAILAGVGLLQSGRALRFNKARKAA